MESTRTTLAETVLLVDDDPDLLFSLAANLEADGYRVWPAAHPAAALRLATRCLPSIALLDVMLPGFDGFELARRLRRLADLPIVMLTAVDDEDARVGALEREADDYITKPFSYRELRARVGSLLARARATGGTGGAAEPEIALDGGVRVDFARRMVRHPAGHSERLSPTELRLLHLFVRNAGQVLPMELVLDRVWPDGTGSTGSIWEYVRRLRRKLGDTADSQRYIECDRGVGYGLARSALVAAAEAPATAR